MQANAKNFDQLIGSAEKIGEKSFKVNARVAMQLGRQSISNSIVAITELIKNAYDADADNVKIRFFGLNAHDQLDPFLIIEDDGVGMDNEQIDNYWLVIGTSNKIENWHSKRKNRVLTGEKGLGRLGLDRLGSYLSMRTLSSELDHGYQLIIEWDKYQNYEELLSEIKHDYYRIPKTFLDPIESSPREIVQGTQYIIGGLRDQWNKEFLQKLRNQLTLLVSPFAGINDFSIEIDSGMGWHEIDGEIGSEYLLKAAEWVLRAEITEDNEVHYQMSSSIHDENYSYGPTPWKEKFTDSDNELSRCGPLIFDLYFYPRQRVEIEGLTINKNEIDEFMRANQGMRIYRDKFRVKPYGEPDGTGDWLTLSFRRQQSPQGVRQGPKGGWRVGYNQVVGAVFIGREKNQELIDQTNRESIVEGAAFNDLRKFASDAIHFFELRRESYEMDLVEQSSYDKAKKQADESTEKAQISVADLSNIVTKIQDKYQQEPEAIASEDLVALTDMVKIAERDIRDARRTQQELIEVAETQQDKLQRQKDTLGNLASLGILAATFGHETQEASDIVLMTSEDLQENLKRGMFMVAPDIKDDVNEDLDTILSEAKKIQTFAKFTIRNIRRDKRTRTLVDINGVVFDVFKHFDQLFAEKSISVDLSGIPEIMDPIKAFRIDWESILINFITNAVWALEKTEPEKRKIRVKIIDNDEYIQMFFADSGIGVEAGMEEEIFYPTVSTKRNIDGIVIGTGMGLAIVESFVEDYPGGKVSVIPKCDLGGAEFYLEIDKPVQVGVEDE